VSGRWEKLAWTVALSRCYNMSIDVLRSTFIHYLLSKKGLISIFVILVAEMNKSVAKKLAIRETL